MPSKGAKGRAAETHQRRSVRPVEDVELAHIALHELTVERGDADSLDPGGVGSDSSYVEHRDEDSLLFLISNAFNLENAKGATIADIDITYAVMFEVLKSDRTFDEDEIQVLLTQARLAIFPFVREKLSTLTADMSLTPLTLPLLRRGSLPPAHRVDIAEDDE